MRLGILLTSSPQHQDLTTALHIARAAREKGHEVEIYLMEDGVYAAKRGDAWGVAEGLAALIRKGSKVSLCATNAGERGLMQEEAVEGVLFASQYELAHLVNESDRFLFLG